MKTGTLERFNLGLFTPSTNVCERTLYAICRLERLHLLVVDVGQDAGQDLQQENTQQQGKILQDRSEMEVS